MNKIKKIIIQVKEHDGSTTEVEVNKSFIDFYKKETGRSKISAKSLSSFINHLIELHP